MVSGKTEGESFVANRVSRGDCKKLTTNERWGGGGRGGCHKIITEPWGEFGKFYRVLTKSSEPFPPRPLAVLILKKVIFLRGKCGSKYIKMVNRCGKSVKIRTKCVHAVLSTIK